MADTTKLTPYERFHALLVPDPSNAEAVRMVQENPTLKTASEAYQKALGTDKAQEVVYNLATQLAGDFNLRPEDVRTSFIESQPLSSSRPQENTTTNQPQVNANPLQGLFGGGGEKNTPLPARVGDRATPVLRSVQEEQLLKEFEDALSDTGPDREDKIRNLLDRMEAPNLIGNQVDIVKDHILNTERVQSAMQQELKKAKTPEERAALEKKFKENLDKDLETQGEKKKKAWLDAQQNPNKTEAKKARDAQTKELDARLTGMLRQEVQGGDKSRAHDAFQRLLTHRMNQTYGYSILEEYASPNGAQDLMLEQLRTILTRVHANAYTDRQQRLRIMQQAASQVEQAQRQPPGQNGIQKILQKTGGKGKLFEKGGLKGLSKGLGQAAKTAAKEVGSTLMKALFGPPYYIGWWILGILALLLVIIAIIVVIIIAIQQHQGPGGTTPTPTVSISPQGLSCSGIDCKNKLASLGIFTSGAQGLNGDPYGRVKLLYETLSKVLQPPSAYGALLGLPRKALSVDFTNGGCTGFADHSGFLFLNGYGSCGVPVAEFMTIHELSHIIAFRNPSLYNKYLNTISISRMRALPTFNCLHDYDRLGWRGPYPGECFADTIGEYVVYKIYRNTYGGSPGYYTGRTLPNFPTTFSDFYNFAGGNVFKGLAF